jgi:HAD superfamily hydrolase (TIGR01490 family)
MMENNVRGAAFFDLDRTIIGGSSLFIFGITAWRNGLMPTKQLISDLRSAIAFKVTGGSEERTAYARDRTLKAIEGIEVSVLKGLGDQITPKLLDEIRSESKGLIDLHHDAGRDTFIVSASPIEIIGEFAEAVGMTGAIGTVAEIADGRYTGELAEPFCYGDGKADAITKLAAQRGYDLRLSYGYTDSISDLPMLEIVGHPVAVNPDHGLASVAYQRGWPIIQFSRRTKLVVKRTTAVAGAAALAGGTYALGRMHGRKVLPA